MTVGGGYRDRSRHGGCFCPGGPAFCLPRHADARVASGFQSIGARLEAHAGLSLEQDERSPLVPDGRE